MTGAPITDMKITLIGGKAHQKHTEGGDFRQATYRAVRQGLMQAECNRFFINNPPGAESDFYMKPIRHLDAIGKHLADCGGNREASR